MQNLAHSASFESLDKDAPSKAGTKHLRRSLQGVGEGPSSMALRPREAALLKEAVAKSFSNLAEVLSGAPDRIKLGTPM